MGANLPSDVAVVGIVIERGDVFGKHPSKVVEAAPDKAWRERRPSPLRGGHPCMKPE
jgi:hypothetical protein